MNYKNFEDYCGSIITPFVTSIREYFEGPDAPTVPYDINSRWIVPRESWHAEINELLIFLCFGILFCILEPIIARTLTKLIMDILNIHKQDRKRFIESYWQMSFYGPIWVFELYIIYYAPWFYNTHRTWEVPFPRQEMSTAIFLLYCIQIGWYLQCTFLHIFIEVRKKDFWPMLLHHLAALILLYYAYTTGYFRCGVLCLFCLDICDVILHFSKLLRFVENTRDLPSFVLILCYITLVSCWVIFRILLFPYKVLYTSFIIPIPYGGWINAENWFFFNVLLFFIFFLQVYWFYLILGIGYKFIRFGEVMDDERDPTKDHKITTKHQNENKDNKKHK